MTPELKRVEAYLVGVAEPQRTLVEALRDTINQNLPSGYEEGIQYSMIGWYVPHTLYPAGYHAKPSEPLPFVSLAAQKHHVGLYLMCIYNDEAHKAWFLDAWRKTGKRLDRGKACLRFKRIDDVAFDIVGEAIRRVPVDQYIAAYQAKIPASKRHRARAK